LDAFFVFWGIFTISVSFGFQNRLATESQGTWTVAKRAERHDTKAFREPTVRENKWPCGPKLWIKVEPYGAATREGADAAHAQDTSGRTFSKR
jgi:hypothetical protein